MGCCRMDANDDDICGTWTCNYVYISDCYITYRNHTYHKYTHTHKRSGTTSNRKSITVSLAPPETPFERQNNSKKASIQSVEKWIGIKKGLDERRKWEKNEMNQSTLNFVSRVCDLFFFLFHVFTLFHFSFKFVSETKTRQVWAVSKK